MKRETTAKALRRMELRLQRLEKRILELSKLIVEELYGEELGEGGEASEAHLEHLKQSGLLEEQEPLGYEDPEEDEEPEEQPRERWIV